MSYCMLLCIIEQGVFLEYYFIFMKKWVKIKTKVKTLRREKCNFSGSRMRFLP